MQKTEGLVKCPIIYLRHIKYCYATWKAYVDKTHKFVLDGISENMDALVQTDKYGAINTTYTTTTATM